MTNYISWGYWYHIVRQTPKSPIASKKQQLWKFWNIVRAGRKALLFRYSLPGARDKEHTCQCTVLNPRFPGILLVLAHIGDVTTTTLPYIVKRRNLDCQMSKSICGLHHVGPGQATTIITLSGWWFQTFGWFDIICPIILGMSSSELAKSIIFQRGRLKPPTSHFEFDRLSETWNDAAFLKSPVGNLN